MEIQVIDDDAKRWGKLKKWQLTGAIYREIPPSIRATREAATWQTMEIVCLKNKVSIYNNGIQIVDADLDEFTKSQTEAKPLKDRPRKGLIGFQNYDGPIQYRNVRLKPISE